VKPFDLDELAARVRALLRRAGGRSTPVIRVGDVQLNPVEHSVHVEGRPVSLSAREFAIIQVLMENVGRVLSREQLETAMCGWDASLESNAVEVHIHHLRRKLGGERILTLRGVGYTFSK
ncbi:MAG: winged helix-turn-helix domain-containing protein, partial [Azovibrio sp.]